MRRIAFLFMLFPIALSANTDDGSCSTLVVEGCMDPAYAEYDASANTDDGSCTTLVDPCAGALVLGSIDATASSDINTADGSATLTVTTGTPTSLTLTGINGTGDYTFAQPGAIDGLATGYYNVTATDANGCTSNTLQLVIPYSLCCDCGVSDQDSDGLCDDEDNCFNRNATNFADPANEACIIPGCMDPAYIQYDPTATIDNGSCTTPIVEGCTDPAADSYDASANTEDGSCVYYGCTDPAYTEYDASANTDDGSCTTPVVNGCTDPTYTEYNVAANTDDGSCQTLASNCDSPSMDGYSYAVVEIGDQCWFAENLRTTVYADDSDIPEVAGNGEWVVLSSGARCDYDNDASNVNTYGRLYNWYAVDDSRGLCPSGWHVPTDGEWTDLEDYITSQGFSGLEGWALKSTSGWFGGCNCFDDFGFSALPGGYRYYANGDFYNAGYLGNWWSSSPTGGDAWYRFLASYNSYFDRYYNNPRYGFSVRCLRDAE